MAYVGASENCRCYEFTAVYVRLYAHFAEQITDIALDMNFLDSICMELFFFFFNKYICMELELRHHKQLGLQWMIIGIP